MKKGILTGPSPKEKKENNARKIKIGYIVFILLMAFSLLNFSRSKTSLDKHGASCYSICEDKHVNQQIITEDILPPCSICNKNQKLAFKCSNCKNIFGIAFEELEGLNACPSCKSSYFFKYEGY